MRARLAMQESNGDTRAEFTRPRLTNRNVRRKLFVDEEETNDDKSENRQGLDENRTNELFEEARSNLEKAKARWNFDFESETPLPGNYVWVKLDKDGNEIPDSISDSGQEIEERTVTNNPEKFEPTETENL